MRASRTMPTRDGDAVDVRSKAERLWTRFTTIGITLQVVGGLVIYWALTNQVQPGASNDHGVGVVLGVIIGGLGLWAFMAGLVLAGVAVSMGSTLGWPSLGEPSRPVPVGPAQSDPAQLVDDPSPFVRHEGDSVIVAQVRRALVLGKSRSAVRRIVEKAERQKPLSATDRAMVEGLIVESQRRPLGPLPRNL